MAYDVDRILTAIGTAADFEERLSAAAALEHALKVELDPATVDWSALVAKALPPLVQGIGDDYKGVQVHCANSLEFLANRSSAVMERLRAVMAGPDSWRAWGAALVAARLGQWYPELGQALMGALGAKDRDVRWAAANFLVSLGRTHSDAVDVTRRTLHDASPIARKMAAYCLGAMGAYADVDSALLPCLVDPDRDVRRAAILAFHKLPTVSPEAKVAIAQRHADEDEYVRRTAAAVAAQLGC